MSVASVSSDLPIQAKEQDQFNRWPFAHRVAQTLATRPDPSSLVVAIYGAWGDGKTSTLRLMEQALKENGNAICINFNPWLFGSTEQLLRGFFLHWLNHLTKQSQLPASDWVKPCENTVRFVARLAELRESAG